MALALILATILVLTSEHVEACSCIGTLPACEAAFRAGVVFSGSVTSIRNGDRSRLVTIRRERTYRIDPGEELEDLVTIQTGFGGGDCGYPFEVGHRYLVYADGRPSEGTLQTGICSRTRPLAEAGEDLAYFATLESGTASSRIFGSLRSYEDSDTPPPLVGITIELRSPNSIRTTATDRDGQFEFRNVPVGGYDVTARVPESLAPARNRDTIFVARGGCAEVDLIAKWDGRIAGTLVDDQDTPAGAFDIEALREGDRFAAFVTTDESGAFTFAGLPPGRYALGTNLAAPPHPDRPYATERIREGISVGPGEHVSLGPLCAPHVLRKVEVTGTVRFTSGARPLETRVVLKSIWEGQPYIGTSEIPADDGTYRFLAFEGVEYEISVAWRGGRYRAGRFVAGRSSPPEPLIVPGR